tara:strand:- start:314 stop:646 length:333 start_codon:yes stop_codon:yes gene_type:complete
MNERQIIIDIAKMFRGNTIQFEEYIDKYATSNLDLLLLIKGSVEYILKQHYIGEQYLWKTPTQQIDEAIERDNETGYAYGTLANDVGLLRGIGYSDDELVIRFMSMGLIE